MQFLIKLILSSLIIAGTTELQKRSNFFAAILISLPMTSILALSFLHFETGHNDAVIKLSQSILLLMIPSIGFFIFLPFLLKNGA